MIIVGKFDGVLFFCDYDDTLYNSSRAVSPENRAAIHYFIDNGGYFSIATGRAHRTFTPQIARERLTLNAPVVLSNGAAIYDYASDRYLLESFLPKDTPNLLAQLCGQFPDLGFEAYHGEDIYVHNPNRITQEHLAKVGGTQILAPILDMPTPWSKVILQQDGPYLEEVQARLLACWGDRCEAIFSNRYLLEVTAKGCDKGAMAAKVADLLYIDRKNLYCMGDNENDIPMLALSAIPFAPANCSQPVRDWGARILNHCDGHAVAQAIGILDELYPMA
ncbi:MAG: HAD-IIB family hydrolase [Oscillospiraceae bacterium]|nr:HAD-IIB family hydrolase [Oscillospiraceae bacterium]